MRKMRALLAATGFLIALTASAAAQSDYPNRPVRLIIPFPAGGSNDIVGRAIAQQMGDRLGRQMIVGNRTRAGRLLRTGLAAHPTPGGHTKVMFSSLFQGGPHIKTGRLRALGTGGKERIPALADVPTIAEAGVPGYEALNWWGLLAPAGTPAPVIERLHKALEEAQDAPEIQAQFEKEGAATRKMSSAEFGTFIES